MRPMRSSVFFIRHSPSCSTGPRRFATRPRCVRRFRCSFRISFLSISFLDQARIVLTTEKGPTLGLRVSGESPPGLVENVGKPERFLRRLFQVIPSPRLCRVELESELGVGHPRIFTRNNLLCMMETAENDNNLYTNRRKDKFTLYISYYK